MRMEIKNTFDKVDSNARASHPSHRNRKSSLLCMISLMSISQPPRLSLNLPTYGYDLNRAVSSVWDLECVEA